MVIGNFYKVSEQKQLIFHVVCPITNKDTPPQFLFLNINLQDFMAKQYNIGGTTNRKTNKEKNKPLIFPKINIRSKSSLRVHCQKLRRNFKVCALWPHKVVNSQHIFLTCFLKIGGIEKKKSFFDSYIWIAVISHPAEKEDLNKLLQNHHSFDAIPSFHSQSQTNHPELWLEKTMAISIPHNPLFFEAQSPIVGRVFHLLRF